MLGLNQFSPIINTYHVITSRHRRCWRRYGSVAISQHDNAHRNDGVSHQRANRHHVDQLLEVEEHGHEAGEEAGEDRGSKRRLELGVDVS